MAISAIGVGSGLPLDELLSDLRKAESSSLALIQSKQAATQSRISAYGSLKASIEQLQKAGKALEDTNIYSALKASVNSDAITVSAGPQAIEGQYSLVVSQLATNQTLATEGIASRTSANGEGGLITFTFGDGSQKTLNLDGQDTSINGLIQAINSEDLGLRATVINDGAPNTPYRLLLSSTETGTDAAIRSISVSNNTDPENTLQSLIGFGDGHPGSTVHEEAAHNASLSVNGIAISSQHNTIEDAIEGVKISLTQTTNSPATLKISHDDTKAQKAITDFVNAYNSLQKTVKTLTTYDVDTKTGSALTGDSVVRQIQTQVRNVLNVSVTSGSIGSLSRMGITTDPSTGELLIDSSKLSEALKNHPDEISQLFADGSNSLTGHLKTVTGTLLRADGPIDSASQGATRYLNDLNKQYLTSQQRIDARIEAYRQQFSALDAMISQMNSVSTYLTQQLSMLSNLNETK